MWQPIRGTNALAEMLVLLEFSQPIEDSIGKLRKIHPKIEEHFPSMQIPMAPSHRISISGGLPQVSKVKASELPEIRFARVLQNGDDEWLLWARANTISVHCLRYTRWTSVWPVIREALEVAAKGIGSSNLVSRIAVQYIDVFEWRGSSTPKYDDLLKENAFPPFKPKDSLASPWHNHQGWFNHSATTGIEKRLERLHIDCSSTADGVGKSAKATHFVKIDNLLRSDLEKPVKSGKKLLSLVDEVVPNCREVNKVTLAAILQDAHIEKISLFAGGSK